MGSDLKSLESAMNAASQFIVNYGFQVLGALIILVVGWFISYLIPGTVYVTPK